MVFNVFRSNTVRVNGNYNGQRCVLVLMGNKACVLVRNAQDFLHEFTAVRSSDFVDVHVESGNYCAL